MPDLIIASLTIPLEALGEHSQSYEVTGGRSKLRMSDGSQVAQVRWAKLATTLRASGWSPAGLAALDPATPVLLACVAPRAVGSGSPAITLPAARRSDVPPQGEAIVAGRIITTPLTMAGNIAMFTPVPGATSYRALYWPLITAYVELSEDTDLSGAVYGWTLTAEEV